MIVESTVARNAIEPMQLQVVIKVRLFDECPKLGSAHVPHVGEPHVVSHQRCHTIRLDVGEAQPLADGFG